MMLQALRHEATRRCKSPIPRLATFERGRHHPHLDDFEQATRLEKSLGETSACSMPRPAVSIARHRTGDEGCAGRIAVGHFVKNKRQRLESLVRMGSSSSHRCWAGTPAARDGSETKTGQRRQTSGRQCPKCHQIRHRGFQCRMQLIDFPNIQGHHDGNVDGPQRSTCSSIKMHLVDMNWDRHLATLTRLLNESGMTVDQMGNPPTCMQVGTWRWPQDSSTIAGFGFSMAPCFQSPRHPRKRARRQNAGDETLEMHRP